MSDPLATLNTSQLHAATAPMGPLCIIAGPGTGKTKTLIARITYLMRQGIQPNRILALTFTAKAAQEMQDRLRSLDSNTETLRVTTFHGLCYMLLGTIQHEELHIIRESDRLELIRTLSKQYAPDISLRELLIRLSRIKNTPEGSDSDPQCNAILKAYNESLRTQRVYDFDDLLREVYEKLRDDIDFRTKVQRRWAYVLIDEFQDTNALQYELLKLLNAQDNLFVIGDPLQSIYGFRGAQGEIFDRFLDDFPIAQRITLSENYRSAAPIVSLTNVIFPEAVNLIAHQEVAGSVQVVQTFNEYREADWIIRTIEQDLGGTDFMRSHAHHGQERSRNFSDYAILYRIHNASRAIKRSLAESGIPYQCIGDDSPYLQKPLRMAIAALRYLAQPDQYTAREARMLHGIPRQHLTMLKMHLDLPPTQFLALVVDSLHLTEDKPNLARDFHQILGTLVRFDALSHKAFLTKLDELAEHDYYDPSANVVTLLSIHAAKGLEFPHVFLIGAEEGLLPLKARSEHMAPTDQEEEKRLFYVAVTRAQEQLTILHTKTRKGQANTVSRFIQAIDQTVLPRITDPGMMGQERTKQRQQYKHAQLGLF